MKGRTKREGRVVQLSDVADLCLGKMLDAKKNKGESLPYLRNPNVGWMRVDTTNLKTMLFEPHEFERYGLVAGDVVVCEGGEAGRAAIWDGSIPEMKFQKAIHRVRPGKELFNRYLVYQLKRDYETGRLREYYTGTTIAHLTGQDLARYRFFLPPLAEQRRIAAILDAVEALREKRSFSIELADSLARATFLEMFGDAAGFPERLLIEVCAPKQWPTITEEQLTDEGYPVYGANGRIGFYSEYNHEDPTVLITCRGATCGTINVCESRSYVTGNAMALDNPTGVSTAYLEWALRVRGLKDTITGSAQPQITRAGLAHVRIPVPPIETQLEFESRLERIRARSKGLEHALDLTKTLQASLQRRLFVEMAS